MTLDGSRSMLLNPVVDAVVLLSLAGAVVAAVEFGPAFASFGVVCALTVLLIAWASDQRTMLLRLNIDRLEAQLRSLNRYADGVIDRYGQALTVLYMHESETVEQLWNEHAAQPRPES